MSLAWMIPSRSLSISSKIRLHWCWRRVSDVMYHFLNSARDTKPSESLSSSFRSLSMRASSASLLCSAVRRSSMLA